MTIHNLVLVQVSHDCPQGQGHVVSALLTEQTQHTSLGWLLKMQAAGDMFVVGSRDAAPYSAQELQHARLIGCSCGKGWILEQRQP